MCSAFPHSCGALLQCRDFKLRSNECAQETLIATFEKFTGMEETTTEPMLFEEFISQKVEHHPTWNSFAEGGASSHTSSVSLSWRLAVGIVYDFVRGEPHRLQR